MRDGVTDFGDHHQPAIEMPADHHLRWRFAVFIRQRTDDFLIEDPFTALRQRAPAGLGLDLVRCIPVRATDAVASTGAARFG